MFSLTHQPSLSLKNAITWISLAAFALSLAPVAQAKKDKKAKELAAPTAQELPKVDTSKLVWPLPPDIARIRWVGELKGEDKKAEAKQPKQKKQKWMDRLAGIQQKDFSKIEPRFVFGKPYGVAVDSKGLLYVADTYVGAIFITNLETKKVEFIRTGKDATFKAIIGLAMDDNDRLFVSDASLHHILVFDANHQLENSFGDDDLGRPSGLALDRENRLLYVADPDKATVVVYDADSFKKLRALGGPMKREGDEDPGVFSKPSNVTVDNDGNVYVSDALLNRIQIFDADGKFVSMFGKNGDGPVEFQRAKGLAIDPDGHIWVADAMAGRIKVFDREGHLNAVFGFPGVQTGMLGLPAGLCFDKQNRLFVTEQLSGRVSYYRYTTETEAAAEQTERDKKMGKKTEVLNQTATAPGAAVVETANVKQQ